MQSYLDQLEQQPKKKTTQKTPTQTPSPAKVSV